MCFLEKTHLADRCEPLTNCRWFVSVFFVAFVTRGCLSSTLGWNVLRQPPTVQSLVVLTTLPPRTVNLWHIRGNDSLVQSSITNSLTGWGLIETVKTEWQVLQSFRSSTKWLLLPNCCLHFRHWLVESELASDKFLPRWVWDGSCLLSTWPFKVLAWAPGLPLGAGAWNPPARMNREVNHEKSPRKAACQMDASHELPGFYPAPCS